MVLAWSEHHIGDSLDTKLVPRVAQIARLEKLHLVCYNARTILLVGRVLQVPATLVLLDVFADDRPRSVIFSFVGQRLPDSEVLHSVSVFVLGWALPCNEICTEGGESELVDVRCRKCGNDVADRGINHRNLFWCCPCEVLAVRRVAAAAKVAFRSIRRISVGTGVGAAREFMA